MCILNVVQFLYVWSENHFGNTEIDTVGEHNVFPSLIDNEESSNTLEKLVYDTEGKYIYIFKCSYII